MHATISIEDERGQQTLNRRGWAGWRPLNEEAKKVTLSGDAKIGSGDRGDSEKIQDAAKALGISTRATRRNEESTILEEVRRREEAAAECTGPLERNGLGNKQG